MAIVRSFTSRLPRGTRIPPGYFSFNAESRDDKAHFYPRHQQDDPWFYGYCDGALFRRPTEVDYSQHYRECWNLDLSHEALNEIMLSFLEELRSAVGDAGSLVSKIYLSTTSRLIRGDCDIPSCMGLLAASLAATQPQLKVCHFSLRKSPQGYHGFCTAERADYKHKLRRWAVPEVLAKTLNSPAWPAHLEVMGKVDVPQQPTGHEMARYLRSYGPGIKFDPLRL